jgi:hypothetical protein
MSEISFLCYKTNKNEILTKDESYLTQDIVDNIFIFLKNETGHYNTFTFILTNNKLTLVSKTSTNFRLQFKDYILCNPIYDVDVLCKKRIMIEQFEKYHFKNITVYNINRFSKIICLNDFRCKCLNNHVITRYYPLNSDILEFISNKCNFAKILNEFNMLEYHPKTYFDLKSIPKSEIELNKTYFLKYADRDAQNGIFVGKLNFLNKKNQEYNRLLQKNQFYKKDYIIQEPIDNCLKYDTNKRIIFGLWFIISSESYYIYDKTTEIAVDETDKHKIKMQYNLLNDADIKDHNIILRNILNVGDMFLKNMLSFFANNNANMNKNQFSLCRMDFLIEQDTYKPYILEVNYNIDLNGRESYKDLLLCEFMVKDKFMSFLYN